MTTPVTPRLGLRVLYTLTESDAELIIQRRRNQGLIVASGNPPQEGDTYPAMIVRDFAPDAQQREIMGRQYASHGDRLKPGGEEYRQRKEQYLSTVEDARKTASVNLQVFLDGNDVYWATSRSEFDPEKHGRWVQVVEFKAGSAGVLTKIDRELPPEMQRDYMQHGTPDGADDIVFRPDPKSHWTNAPVAW